VSGERRFRALKLLQQRGELDGDFALRIINTRLRIWGLGAQDVNLMVFLARAMKSIAWADRTSAKVRREVGLVDDRPADIDPMEMSHAVGLEEQVIQQDLRRKQVDAVMALFLDDEDAMLWLMAHGCGFVGRGASALNRNPLNLIQRDLISGAVV
jgi:hypothetical protein